MADPIEAPQYVLTDWTVTEFDPGPGLPVITPYGVLVADQSQLDAVALAAGSNNIVLTYTQDRPPFANDNPTTDRPYVRYDAPQALSGEQQQQARENIGVTLYGVGNLP